jgi:S1-C subfamily serine protease
MTTQDTLYRISRMKPGDKIDLTLVRKGKTIDKQVVVGERPTQEVEK